ncbi:hypothetical protein CHT76_08685 [Listeria monocytogenes]|nr:hypothetical protein [Listeria monocytogenes]EAG8712034.1 hypothetical protein [Listeria monocytogenes]EAG8730880.1 hypothetical protein [Listeria monocytogenes]
MGRPKLMSDHQITASSVHGAWDIDKFAAASPRSKSWWYKHIYEYPEIKKFSNWDKKTEREQWAFDAAKANEWLIKTFVYKEA